MNHPFSLNISDLEALDINLLTDEEATQVEGGILPGGCYATTEALGEEGGGGVSTKALGEEGGSYPHPVKEPHNRPKPTDDSPVYTTLAVGEEGGS